MYYGQPMLGLSTNSKKTKRDKFSDFMLVIAFSSIIITLLYVVIMLIKGAILIEKYGKLFAY